MKTKTFEKKLVLNKKTIAHLEAREQNAVKGGDKLTATCPISYCGVCPPSDPTCETCPSPPSNFPCPVCI